MEIEEIKSNLIEKLKPYLVDSLNQESKNENTGIYYEELKNYFKKLKKQKLLKEYRIKMAKLPRKLKKKYQKQNKLAIDYFVPVEQFKFEYTINMEELK